MDAGYRVRAGEHSRTLNFDKMKELYLSKDLERNKEFSWTSSEKDCFLDGTVNMLHHSAAFCSYPRSGNTFLRNYIESITGITTGSNWALDRGAVNLQTVGLKGEEIVSEDNTVWLNKSHRLAATLPGLEFTSAK